MKERHEIQLPPLPILLLTLAAFLIPFIGGYLWNQNGALAAGLPAAIVAMTDGAGAPQAHLLLGGLVLVAFLIAVFKRTVIQLPPMNLAGAIGIFMLILAFSVGVSDHKFQSLEALTEWLVFGLAVFAVVANSGRLIGPRWIIGGLIAGCSVVSVYGVVEYLGNPDTTWRIFVNWVNPNALAGMLLLGLMLGVGSMLAVQHRGMRLALGIACSLMMLAILLTGSKGGLLAELVGLLALIAMYALSSRSVKLTGAAIGSLACVLLLTGVLAFGVTHKAKAPGQGSSGAAFGRITSSGQDSEQSGTFRKLLWKGAARLASKNPAGVGIGNYRFHSAETGEVTQTQLAHNSFLQIAAEASWAALALFLAILVLWSIVLFRGTKNLPAEQNHLRSAVFAAILASLVHSLIDSDLYYFGIGLAFFMLLAVGLQLSADAATPEFTPKPLRFGLAAGGTLLFFALGYFAWDEYSLNRVMDYSGQLLRFQQGSSGEISSGDQYNAARQELIDLVRSMQGLASLDDRVWYNSAVYLDNSPGQRANYLRQAIANGPSTKTYRSLSDEYLQQSNISSARHELVNALNLDPNNLLVLKRLLEIDKKNDPQAAKDTAKKIIAVEDSSYLRITALPQFVPTETFEARRFLADQSKDPKEQAVLLRPAVEGYRNFAARTVPQITEMAKAQMTYSGLSIKDAQLKIQDGIDDAKLLEGVYGKLGDSAGASWAEESAKEFGEVLAALAAPPLGANK